MATQIEKRNHATSLKCLLNVIGLLVFLAVPSAAYADPLGAGGGTTYRLGADSQYMQGCFDPCLCPIMLTEGVRGTFKLTFQDTDPNTVVHSYRVSDVNWTVPNEDPNLRVIGSGTYQRGSPDPITVVQHRLQLDLRIGDEPVEHFDSGWVPVEQNAGINITVSMNGMFCFDTAFVIASLPVPPDEIQHYTLADGSTFHRGCFDPCDCPLEQERPLAGTFDLVPLFDNGTIAEFAVVNANWSVPPNAAGDVTMVKGFGIYQRFSQFAMQHRLALELIVDGDNRTHFDSGLVVTTEPFPRIDIVITMNQMVCFDIVMHVIADPHGGQVCGGFAGITCPTGQFCKFPMGTCMWSDLFGVCTPSPDGCPDIWDPVCGCDGVTYGNECEADAAGVTVDHPGECNAVCEPLPDGFGCTQVGCSDIPEEMCLATVLHLDIATGAITTRACDCLDFNVCHIEFGNASPFAVGYCPSGFACQVFATDTDNDGIDDEFSAGCVGAPIGACCLDIDDGPVAFDTCVSTDLDSCHAEGGIFFPGPTDCDHTQACCLSVPGAPEFCVDLPPMCCAVSGGIPQGVGTTCADHPNGDGCGQVCGGFAYIPCDDPDQFCNLPVGGCCCDLQGVCMTPPTDCPAVYDPVCGCDGVTYGNACEAAAAGESINNIGPCENVCPEIWDPVCGIDGVTYTNACFAELAGVPIAHPGECGAVCGGLGPHPPCPSDEFCKFPPGICANPTVPGECRQIPNGCPDVWDPVCGCDGQTYGNECEADAASMSVDHPGECDPTGCAATRILSHPDLSYCPGVPKSVRIILEPPAGVTVVALDDAPPTGWAVTHISDGGTFDAVNGKVKWGPFFAPNIPGEVSYRVVATDIDVNAACFAGMISLDGANSGICGDACIPGVACCPHMDADKAQPLCPHCPTAGCDNAAGTCGDGLLSLHELISYACAWLMGCNDDLSGMTRAAYIWRSGECYCWDDVDMNWHPTTCPAPANGCCVGRTAATGDSTGSVQATILWSKLKRGAGVSRDGVAAKSREIQVEVSIVPPDGTQAAALEMDVPAGWSVINTSEGGQWDAAHHKVKWGPIFGDESLTLTYTMKRLPIDVAPMAHRYTGGISPRGLVGTVSFDGVNQPVSTR